MEEGKEARVIGQPAVLDSALDARDLPGEPDPAEAFRLLLEEQTGPLLALAQQMLRDREEARDLLQDALLRAHQALGSFRRECSMKTWVRRIVINMALKKLRRRRLRERVTGWLRLGKDPVWAPAQGGNPEQEASVRQDMQRLASLMRTLSPKQQAVLVLRHQEGLSVAEIADAMEIGAGTVKTHLVRAMRQIRAGLGPDRERTS